jgi:hypothetical protein
MKYQLVPKDQLKQTNQEYFEGLADDKIIELYEKTKDWLLKHEAQPDTNNQIDVSGEPYNQEQYEAELRLLEKIEDKGRKRQLAAFLSDEEIKAIFSPNQP